MTTATNIPCYQIESPTHRKLELNDYERIKAIEIFMDKHDAQPSRPLVYKINSGYGAGNYRLVLGEEVLQAALNLCWGSIDVDVLDSVSQETLKDASRLMPEACEAHFLDTADRALSLTYENKKTQKEAAKVLGLRDQPHCARLIGVAKLPSKVKEMIRAHRLSETAAVKLSRVPSKHLHRILVDVISRKLTTRKIESLVSTVCGKSTSTTENKSSLVNDPDVKRFLRDLSEKIGANVTLRDDRKGGYQMKVNAANREVLNGIFVSLITDAL